MASDPAPSLVPEAPHRREERPRALVRALADAGSPGSCGWSSWRRRPLPRRLTIVNLDPAAGASDWVQTPYRYFPLEPHWLFPGMQLLPFPARAVVRRYGKQGHIRLDTWEDALSETAWVELVGRTEMRMLFPGSQLWVERFAGLPRSLVAVKAA